MFAYRIFSNENNRNGLEQLLLINQKYLVKIRDYFVIDMGLKANSLIIVEYEAFPSNLFDKLNNSKTLNVLED